MMDVDFFQKTGRGVGCTKGIVCLFGWLCFAFEFVLFCLVLARSLACCSLVVYLSVRGDGVCSVWSAFERCRLVCVEVRKEDVW